MMIRRPYAVLAIVLPVFAWACSDSDHVTQPTSSTFTSFFAQLAPSQVQVGGPVAPGTPSGAMTMTLNLSMNGSNDIQTATGNFSGSFDSFQGLMVTSAHVNSGAAGTIGPIVIDLGITRPGFPTGPNPREFPTGFSPFNVTVPVSPAVAAHILANPSGFYFEADTALSPSGAVRGQFANVTVH
jgi:hypothetical protein